MVTFIMPSITSFRKDTTKSRNHEPRYLDTQTSAAGPLWCSFCECAAIDVGPSWSGLSTGYDWSLWSKHTCRLLRPRIEWYGRL